MRAVTRFNTQRPDTPIDELAFFGPEFLTDALRGGGVLGSGKVVNVEVIFHRTLKVSRVARLRLGYGHGKSAAAPNTVFLKLSASPSDVAISLDPSSEVVFYSDFGSTTPAPPIIRCFGAGVMAETGSAYLFLEDLTETHSQPRSPQPPSLEMSRLAVKSLARFHAHWWENERLGNGLGEYFDQKWLDKFVDELGISFEQFLGAVELTSERRRIYQSVLSASQMIWGRLTDPSGLTVVNGDTHWWNFLYPNDQASEDVRLFDWQLWHLDLGARDLAFLVALGGFADRRPEVEQHLVDTYFSSLLENGVTQYPLEAFLVDYRLSAIRNLNIPVIYWAQGRKESEWRPLLERAFEAFEVLRCGDLI